jgi:hypothetical protein
MANTVYFSMIHLFKSKTMHRKNKTRMYKTIVRPVLRYECETWTMANKVEQMFLTIFLIYAIVYNICEVLVVYFYIKFHCP